MNLKTVGDNLLINLKTLDDNLLIEKTNDLVREERETLTNILHHFREIERRRLFSSLGCKSLFEMAVKKFGYSEDQAYRRISAMRLLKDLPEIEGKINSGEISLMHMSIAQNLFRKEKKFLRQEISKEDKLLFLKKVAYQSTRETEKIALSFSSEPDALRPDRVQVVSDSKVELKFLASTELLEKIEKLKGILAHQNPNLNLGELFENLCDLGLKELDPAKTGALQKRRIKFKGGAKIKTFKQTVSALDSKTRVFSKAALDSKTKVRLKERVKSMAQIRRDVFRKAHNKCENCNSNYALEIDHILPQAKGGSSSAENLRLLCRSCNQRAAIKEFGLRKMEPFIK
ncbi:MAG: HNH endonuclease signature motif containing protein [Bdellovibrionota bacterium]